MISIGLAVIGLAFGYGLSFLWFWLALGLGWLIGEHRGWVWGRSLGLVMFTGAAAFGVWQDRAAGWLLFSLIAALVAWDLSHFAARLHQAEPKSDKTELMAAHLQRLSIVAGLGLLLGWLALGLQIELRLGWAILLGLLAIIGLSRLVGFSRRQELSDE